MNHNEAINRNSGDNNLVLDKRGRVPNYIVVKEFGDCWLVHQPTGMRVFLCTGETASKSALRLALNFIKQKIKYIAIEESI